VFEPGATEPLDILQQRALDYLRTYYGARLEPSATVA